ncbi:hypothetical protein B0H66DRAFT_535353 [Apodospora peruviana]|uniref:Uncharacterized protein n=1 Tax=Apodospora peruviana TaxID=516989 RepID=A0AAE0HX18_9PEZI|nr:hypothetical protein B0H66DRAFT_535353 [Apodospora peruviana]
MPAASYGLWGLRATRSLFPLKGIMPAVPLGILTRSPLNLRKFLDFTRCSPVTHEQSVAQAADQQSFIVSSSGRPANIIIPTDWFLMKNEGQQKMVDHFTKVLVNKIGINVLRLSFEAEWAKTGPKDLRSKTLLEYLDKQRLIANTKSISWPNYYDGYHSYDQFRRYFQAKFGHSLYTSPFMTRRWGLASDITEDEETRDTEYNFVLLPLGRPGANYRDIVPTSGSGGGSLFSESVYDPIDFCTVLGLPQPVIPIGQNPYESRVTAATEYAPIVASLVGRETRWTLLAGRPRY